MPTVAVKRDELFRKIGQSYSDTEFDKLCFEFGIELDEINDSDSNNVEYKIDIPANRYDLLCVDGIGMALAVFTNRCEYPQYKKVLPYSPIKTFVDSSTSSLRPFVVTAVLRDMQMSQEVYTTLIDLQEKLHISLCRKRTLVAIGVHDLDKLTPPFRYSLQPPKEINFVPLNQQKSFRADELMEFYKSDTHLKPYLPIIKDELAYPIIRDINGIVLSLPPIINGEHSKVTLQTKNIFIECTATDRTKAEVVLDTMVSCLSGHCKTKWEVEATEVIYSDGKQETLPGLEYKTEILDVNTANTTVGIQLTDEEMAKSLSRMGLKSSVLCEKEGKISVEVPPTRHDILHQCDIYEDVAISYGYSKIKSILPPTPTVASQNPLNKLTSQLRESLAQAGFTETLTFSLCSMEDECEKLQQPRNVKAEVVATVSNPKAQDFQCVRTTLLSGLLKTIQANKNMPLPLKLFEISDVVILDGESDTGARNVRKLVAVNYNKVAGLEIIHGLLDRIMILLDVKFKDEYVTVACEDPTFFPGRCADIIVHGKSIGKMGVLHPKVVENFDCNMPCSALEIEIEGFL